ncbi:leucyl-cystinyl aminopeptidase-like [Leptonychotes weddellii]|uniref:Leucyl-cystinyl aminopeptidase-like n=1 Tax=Leptonychotes weddellii TaxID=9713 RepID=A0A7F8QUD4_LEPWE|nr:leucyl-cystinyl aminopeptidase-like [Leptonychotes weddellii]
MDPFTNDLLQLPRNMIENSMFEEEPDVVDLAKEPCLHPLEPDEVEYEPRGSRLLVRGLGEHEMDEDEEDYESSAKLLGMSFMNRSSGLRNSATGYRPSPDGTCSVPSVRTMAVCVFLIVVAVSIIMVIYLLPRCTFTKEGCHKKNQSMGLIQPLATNGKLFPWAQVRLPTAIMPLRYELNLHPNLTSMTFKGSVTISLQALQATWNIILHSTGHNISRVTFMSAVSSQEKQVEVLEYPFHEQIAIVAPETLLEGHNYTLKIEYSANISSSYYGLYGISYRGESNEKKYFAATQFEPLAARSAFPCFDEPGFKATFIIRIIRDEQYTALSNMPKNSSVIMEDGLVQDEFSESVKMSTYLVAFIVGEMKNLSQDVNGTLVSIYAVPEKIGQVHHALETTVKLLEFYQNYFEIQYPLKKLDGELLLSRSREGFTKMFFGNDDILFSDDPVSLKSLNSCMPGSELLVYASYPGASLLLMLKTYLSEDVFQHAVVFYLHNHSYASIQSDDLWDSFNEHLYVINLTEEVQWVKVNTNMNGYYIVHYEDDDWEALIKQLKTNPYVLSDKDRANLINNIFELAGLGKVSLQRAFDLIDYLGNETYTAPITETLFQTGLIYNLLEKLGYMDLASRVVTRVSKLLRSQIRQQTWTDEGSPCARELRSVLLEFACVHGLENCSATAMTLFDDWVASNGTQR